MIVHNSTSIPHIVAMGLCFCQPNWPWELSSLWLNAFIMQEIKKDNYIGFLGTFMLAYACLIAQYRLILSNSFGLSF